MTYLYAVLTDPFWRPVLNAALMAALALFAWYSVDIVLYLTKRDFTHLQVQIVRFTRHDRDSHSDMVLFRSIDRLRLRPVLNNRYLFLSLMWAGMRATRQRIVLHVGKKEYAIFSAIRSEVLRRTVTSEFKRDGGLPFVQIPYRLFIVYDRSDDKRSFVLRGMLVQERDLAQFETYIPHKRRPKNRDNLALVRKIWEAHNANSCSSISIVITAA